MQNTSGSAPCTHCPAGMSSPPGSVSASNCSCDIGFSADSSGACVPCAQGSYKNELVAGHCTTCEAGTRFLPAGSISVLAGSTVGGYVNEVGTKARFSWMAQSNLAVTPDGSEVFVADSATYTLRAINLKTGQVRKAAGNCILQSSTCSFAGPNAGGDGSGHTSQFSGGAETIRMTPNGTAVVVDGNRFRVVNITDGALHTIYTFTTNPRNLGALGITPDGESIWVADEYYHKIFQLNINTGQQSEVTGWSDQGGAGRGGYADGHAESASFENPTDIVFTPDGSTALVAEAFKVRSIDVATRRVSTLAGAHSGFQDGVGTKALFSGWIRHIIITPDGRTAYVGCHEGNFADSIRKIDLASRAVTTVINRQSFPNPPYAMINSG